MSNTLVGTPDPEPQPVRNYGWSVATSATGPSMTLDTAAPGGWIQWSSRLTVEVGTSWSGCHWSVTE